ncbi:extracellular matrix/biofilm biosynthesis regulator RemA family protein [Ectobacillus funiculus]|uniref:extracellular matrix/biofilm biosynthesis regulator RemA family protein n=1 Tax=Ectobacillus funiculus TaxID=137993 RepID=UPI00101C21D5
MSSTRILYLCIESLESAPIKRLVQKASEQNLLLYAIYDRNMNVMMDEGHSVLSLVQPETIAQRLSHKEDLSDEGQVYI